MRTFAGILACGLVVCFLAPSQTGTATLVGSVTDSSGAVIGGAQVTVVNTETSFHTETVTGSEGSYQVPYLSPGSYQITLEAPGFKRYVREGIVVRTGETPRVDVVLQLGAVTDEITVKATNALLATESAVEGQILESGSLAQIENPQGSTVRFVDYYPGVITQGLSTSYNINGLRQSAIAYTLDGMNGKTPGTNVFGDTDQMANPNAFAVQEISVNTTGMSAEYGNSAGGAMSVVFRSGTNEFHGSVDEREIWKKLVQRDFLTQAPDTTPLNYNWFNGGFAGPVRIPKLYNGKNKTFFLFAFGGFLQSGGQPVQYYNVPTPAMESGNFDFGAKSLTIYNPYSITKNSAGTYTSTPFPNNQIPASLIDPVVKNFLSHNPFAQPNTAGVSTQTGPQQNLVLIPAKYVRRYRTDVKIDHQFSSNHKIFGRFSEMNSPYVFYPGSGAFAPQIGWTTIDPGHMLNPTRNINSVLSDTYLFGPTRFNEIRLGYNRRDQKNISPTDGTNWSQQLGIPNVPANGFPVFSIPTYGYFGSLAASHQAGQDIQFADTFTQILGSHTIKVGYTVTKSSYDSVLQAQPAGTYTFGGSEAPFTPNTGNPFADFLLGTVSSAVYTQNYASWLPRWWNHGVFVQDSWKVMRSLTLNLGLRWDYETPFQTKYGQQSQFNPTAPDPLTGLMGAITHPGGPLAKSDWNNFQPRIGLAWSFRPKWVFRASFGIMTDDITTFGTNQNFNEYQGTSNVQQLPGNPLPAFTLSQGPPSFSYPLQSNGSVAYVGTNYSARNADWMDPKLRMPYVMMWSGGFQYEFAHNWMLELVYQGNAGVGLLESWNINQINPATLPTNPATLAQIYAAQQNYKPYPQFGAVNLYSNFGHSTYHAGTVRVERRYTNGLTLTGYYTLAKALDECDTDGACNGENYYDRSLEKGRAGFDIRHAFQSIVTYELPFGKGRRWMSRGGFVDQVLGGWNFTSTWQLQSGTPDSVTLAGGPNKYLTLGGVYRPDALVPISQAVVQNWSIGPNRFPTSAQNPYLRFADFAYPPSYALGTLGRNVFEGPGMNWLQIGLSKTWRIAERVNFMLRAEGNDWPFKQPELFEPNAVYNVNSANLFGTFTSLRQPFSQAGQSRPQIVLGARITF